MTMVRRPLADRFWEKVDKNGPIPGHRPELGPCWVWTAYRDRDGYGRISRGGHGGPVDYANRAAFFLAHGRWPEPVAMHHCDNPACVKAWADESGPAHIVEGTRRQNSVDSSVKGQLHFGERDGMAKLTEEGVRRIRSGEFRGMTQEAIGKILGVSDAAVSLVMLGKTWRHVQGGH